MADQKVLHGAQAVQAVTQIVGRELTLIERRIVEEEGYVAGSYRDTKGIETSGVGQTGEFQDMSFEDTVRAHVERARGRIPSFDSLPEELQAELVQAEYRGDLGESPKFLKLLNDGKFAEAADEFLDNNDYRESLLDKTGVAGRMQRVSEAVRNYGLNPEPVEKDRQYYVDRGLEVPYDPDEFIPELQRGWRHELDVMRSKPNPPLMRPEEAEGLMASNTSMPAPQPEPAPEPEAPAPQPEPPGILRVPEGRARQPSYEDFYAADRAAKARAKEIGWWDLTAAAARRDNSLGILLDGIDGMQVPDYDFDFDAWQKENAEAIDAITGDQEEIGEILGRAVSADHADQLLQHVQQIEADEKMFQEAGLKGMFARMPMMLLDPIDIGVAAVAAPIGSGVMLTRLGAAVKAAAAAGVSNATIEAYAAAGNPYRDGGDVALAGLAGLFLGGGVGALTAKSNRRLRELGEKMLEEDMAQATVNTLAKNLKNNGDAGAAKRVLGTGEEPVPDKRLAPTADREASEIVDDLPDQEFGYGWINKLQRNFIGRMFYSTNDTIRKVSQSILEGGLLVDKKATRAATAEGRANNLFQTAVTRIYRASDKPFKEWAERQGYGTIQREAGIEAGERFYTEVGRALRGETEDIAPEAAKAAGEMRVVLDEIAKLARESGIPGFENPIENFFPRFWDDDKLTRLTEKVDRDTQGLWFKQALLNKWDEMNPRPDTTKLELELGDEQVRLDSAVAEADVAVQAAEEALAKFKPRQKGIGEAKKALKEAKRAQREAAREAKSHAKYADERIKMEEAEIPESVRQELEDLRNEVEDLRQKAEGKGEGPERVDLREAQRRLHEAEDKVNKKLRRAQNREATAERIGKAFANALARRNLGINDMMARGIPLDDTDRMHQLLDGTGLSKEEIDDFVAGLNAVKDKAEAGSGNVKHAKPRLHFDETLRVEVGTRDGGKMMLGLDDMTITDASKAIPRYLKTMTGWIGLAKESGIRGQRDIDNILIKAKEDGATHDEITALRDAFKLLTGRSIEDDPAGFGSQFSRTATALNYPRFGASFGIAQLPEIGNIIGEVGWVQFMRDIPELRKLIKQAKDGTLDDATAREIDEIIGAGTDYLTRRAQKNFSVEDGVQVSAGHAAVDAATQRLGRVTQVVSLMAPINAVLERYATRSIMRDWGRIAKAVDADGKVKIPEWKRARLRNAGLSDEMQERVFAQLRDKAKYDDRGILEVAQPHKWDDVEAADAYRLSLDRERRMTIQRNDIGNTGSYIHKPMGRVLTQFMNFMLNSINKQLVRGVHFRDIQTFTSWSASMFIGGLAYTGQTYADYANDPERRRERLTAKRIGAAAYQRAGFSAITVPLIDSSLTLLGVDPLFKYGRTSGLGTDFVTGNPTFSGATDLAYTLSLPLRLALNEDYQFSRADAQRIERLLPLQRALGVKNAFTALESGLPKTSQ